jgi:hypothetical protein
VFEGLWYMSITPEPLMGLKLTTFRLQGTIPQMSPQEEDTFGHYLVMWRHLFGFRVVLFQKFLLVAPVPVPHKLHFKFKSLFLSGQTVYHKLPVTDHNSPGIVCFPGDRLLYHYHLPVAFRSQH